MKRINFLALSLLAGLFANQHCFGLDDNTYDVGVYGFIFFADGIGRQSVSFVDCLKNDLKVNFLNTRGGKFNIYLADVPNGVQGIAKKGSKLAKNNVSVLTDVLTNGNPEQPELYYKQIDQNSLIKIAYSRFESTEIPGDWVSILNDHFDAVVVPDEFLVDVYKNSGVNIPLFVLPLGVYMDEFLQTPLRTCSNKPFVFGSTAAFDERKNHKLLLESFAATFGNNSDVVLKLQGRYGQTVYKELTDRVKELNLTNVDIKLKILSWQDYGNFINSLDCYVSVSNGDSFSVSPREAMAAGIPCIVANNSAQAVLCKSGFVCSVAADKPFPAYYPHIKKTLGNYFVCQQHDVEVALKNVYQNYESYLCQAAKGREWVQQYKHENLKSQYLNLVKPNSIELGNKNSLEGDCLVTDSEALFKKYQELLAQS